MIKLEVTNGNASVMTTIKGQETMKKNIHVTSPLTVNISLVVYMTNFSNPER